MTFKNFTFSLLIILLLGGCGKAENTDVFEYNDPVDLTAILRAYDWYKSHDEAHRDSILYTLITPNMPEDAFYLFDDTSFVLRVPEYADAKQPFLANAEEFYNSCLFGWNIYSNFEVWYRGHTADLLRNDEDVKSSINNLSVNILHDKDVRNGAQHFKESVLRAMTAPPDQWEEGTDVMDYVISYGEVIASKAYKFYDNEETFVDSLDSVMLIAEGLAMNKFKHYLDAAEDDQLKVIIGELATCQSFDEQCSLWRNWANCPKSIIENEWLIAVGTALMESGHYSPVLHNIWITWRALYQVMYYGLSRDSAIPNHFYNEYRKKCYITCLKRIATHPSDVFAMNCAAAISGRTNLNRFGLNYFGNEAMIEEFRMMPKRYQTDDEEDDEDEEYDIDTLETIE